MKIRMTRAEDAEQIAGIYRFYTEHTAVTFDCVPPDARFFEEKIARTLARYPFLTLEKEGRVAGFAYASPFKDRPAYDFLVETTLYLEKDQRGRGYGKELYEALENELKRQNVLRMEACVALPRASGDPYLSDASVRFHEKLGFHTVGRFEKSGWKFGRWFDMIWMEKTIGEEDDPPRAFVPYGELT